MEYRAKCYSEDGTIKYLFDVATKGFWATLGRKTTTIESAFLHIPERDDQKPEYVLCLSSMAGCVYRCLMCANMFSTFYGCLTPHQINKQIEIVLSHDNNLKKITRAGSVEYAFMAIGEPLYGRNVIQAIQQHTPYVPSTYFSLSTVGAQGTIEGLTDSKLPFSLRLEISLHFSNDETRGRWMQPNEDLFRTRPVLNIVNTLEEAERYAQKHPGKVTLNYALIDGINNTDRNLDELVQLLRGRTDVFYVKVMWPNITSSLVFSWKEELGVKKTYSPPEFQKALIEAGIPATLFESKGRDIFAGCGMMKSHFSNVQGVFTLKPIPEADPAKLGF